MKNWTGIVLLLIGFLCTPLLSKHKKRKHKKSSNLIQINSSSLLQKTKNGARMTIGGMGGGGITLNMPPPYYPKVMANPAKQKPIIVVPEIVYPRQKKRVIVHHGVGMMDYYRNILNNYTNPNPYFLEMAKANPYWAPFIKDNQAYKMLTEAADIAPKMKKVKGSFKAQKKGSSMSGGSKFRQLV